MKSKETYIFKGKIILPGDELPEDIRLTGLDLIAEEPAPPVVEDTPPANVTPPATNKPSTPKGKGRPKAGG